MADNYSDSNGSYNEIHHLRRDSRDAHVNSQLAKWLSIISLIIAAIALTVAIVAFNKAGEAESTANQAQSSASRALNQ